MKRKSIAGLIAIVAVAAVVMFSGCVEEEAPVSTPIPSPTPTPAVTPSSILSPTPTVQPTTPTPESKKPEILSMNSYIGNLGYFNVVGEVKNNLQSNINYVKLTATFYDAQEKVIGTDFTYAELDILKPNQKAPFEISSYPDKITPKWYKVHLSYDKTSQSPFTGLAILSHSDKIDNLGYHEIVGEVKNKGVSASSYVKVVCTYYNVKGEVIGTDFTFTDPSDIDAGDRAPFELSSYPRKLRPSSYELQVEGN